MATAKSKSKPKSKLKPASRSKAPKASLRERAAELRATLVLRRPNKLADAHSTLGKQLPYRKVHLTPADFAASHAAVEADIRFLRGFARKHGLQVEEVRRSARLMILAGPEAAMSAVFSEPTLAIQASADTSRKSTKNDKVVGAKAPSIPAELTQYVDAVFGVHFQSVAVQRAKHWHTIISKQVKTKPSKSTRPSISDLEQAYGFPPGTDGAGQCIAILEFGGGFHREDLQAYFSSLGKPMPKITEVSVDGVTNQPASPQQVHRFLDVVEGKRPVPKAGTAREALDAPQCTVETTMDVELAGALAPAAHLVVYFASPTEQGIVHALSQAIHDHRNRPSVISISWGEAEPSFSEFFTVQIDRLLHDAAHLGITVCASSGDMGAKDGSPDGEAAVNFPASSPHCLGCGGTTVEFAGSRIVEEKVWNAVRHGIPGATGGGVSRRFGLPEWQRNAAVPSSPLKQPGRGVPDVAGPADPDSGPAIIVGGRESFACGTSAVVPFWAAMIARFNQALHRHTRGSRCGYLNPLMYKIRAGDVLQAGGRQSGKASGGSPFRPILKGENGGYVAGPGWNPCTGLGSPIGERLFALLVPKPR